MADSDPNLSGLKTEWQPIGEAGESQGGSKAEAARKQLLVRYQAAVQRYLRKQLRDPNAADEVFSDFGKRVLEGDRFLKQANPERGRFRDYLKVILKRMVIDYYRSKGREEEFRRRLQEEAKRGGFEYRATSEEGDGEAAERDEAFKEDWKQEVINQAWKALERVEKEKGQPYHTLMRLQESESKLRSAQLAERVSAQLGRPFTAANIRQLIHRGRELFGELIVQEVARTLREQPDEKVPAERVEEELIELRLLFSYCKDALERYAARE